MGSDIKVRKVVQDVLLYVCFKHGIIEKEPSPDLRFIPEITNNHMKNLCVLVWIESQRNHYRLGLFFSKHFHRITSTPELFAKYVYYAHDIFDLLQHPCRSFIKILAVVIFFSLRCWDEGRKEFLNAGVDLFCAFFEKELRVKFEEEGGWLFFNERIEISLSSDVYQSLIRCKCNKSLVKCFENPETEMQKRIFQTCKLQSSSIGKASRKEVETEKNTRSLAESVADIVRERCSRTFEETLTDFAKTDRQVEELYRKSIGETSDLPTGATEQCSSQQAADEELENIPNNANFEENESEKQTLIALDNQITRNSDNINFQNVETPKAAASHLSLKSKKSEKTKELLDDMSEDIEYLLGLIQSLCHKHGVEVEKHERTEK